MLSDPRASLLIPGYITSTFLSLIFESCQLKQVTVIGILQLKTVMLDLQMLDYILTFFGTLHVK